MKKNWVFSMKFKIEYSKIVKRKMKALKKYLTDEFGAETARAGIKTVMKSIKQLSDHPEKGISVAETFDVDTDFRYLYVKHNYFFYYIENDKVIIAEMFNEQEDFMYKLFGISSISEESEEYWGE